MALLATGWDRERLKARELLGASARGAAGGRPLREASVLRKHKNQSRHRDVSQQFWSGMVPYRRAMGQQATSKENHPAGGFGI
jgi:hypothetical protein